MTTIQSLPHDGTRNLFLKVGWAVAFVMVGSTLDAHSPVDFFEVIQGNPSNRIDHDVETQSRLDEQKVETNLEGPLCFSVAVGCMGRTITEPRSYLSWYKIIDPPETAPRTVSVLDLVRGVKTEPLTIGSAEYLLSPAQRIVSGPPSSIPHGLDHYKAYRVLDGSAEELDISLTGSEGSAERVVGKPIFLCVPTRQWHHDKQVRVSHRNSCFVVYELDRHDLSSSIGLIDQFGLNQLSTRSSDWLGVVATLRKAATD